MFSRSKVCIAATLAVNGRLMLSANAQDDSQRVEITGRRVRSC